MDGTRTRNLLGGLGDVSCPGRTTGRGTAQEAPQSKIGRPRPARRAGGVDSTLPWRPVGADGSVGGCCP